MSNIAVEWIDNIQFVLMDKEQFHIIGASWKSAGGEVEDVGDGIHLFSADRSVIFRTRVNQSN